MKTIKPRFAFSLLVLSLLAAPAALRAQGTAFTYQGRLTSDANAANGAYDLTFSVWTNATGPAQVGVTLTNFAVTVSNGLFIATLDFGDGVFTGADRWLEIAVRTKDTGAFTTLTPRQRLTATPYAITAANITGVVPNAGVAGTYANAVTLNNAANQFTGSFSGNGSGLSNVNALTIGGLTSAAFWKLDGNNVAPGQFLGSTNDHAVEIRVNSLRALRLEPDASGAPNVIAGSPANLVDPGVAGATISGGGTMNSGGSAFPNRVSGYFGSIGGGIGNLVQGFGSVIGGGYGNTITFAPYYSMIAGGDFNTIDNSANNSFIGGGLVNTNSAPFSAIVGGRNNTIEPAADLSFIGGGWLNFIQGGADQSVIAGGNAGQILSGARESFIGGGFANTIQTNAAFSFIGAGTGNMIGSNSVWGTIPGGQDNVIQPDTSWATIGGGTENSNSGRYATIGGGLRNSAAGFQSTIGGGVVNSIGANSIHSTIGGGQGNVVSANTSGIFIGGGVRNTVGSFTIQGTIAGGWSNSIVFNLNQPTIAGGFANSIQGGGDYSFIGGGARNTNSGFVSLITGGQDNTIGTLADHSVIAGGGNNRITGSQPFPVYATISGGQFNSIQTNAIFSVIGGGSGNTVQSNAQYATIPGGASNSVAGTYSFAAGNRASALHDGTFVWADANGTNFSSTASNQFLIRASGGVGIGRTNPVSALDVNGVITATGFSGSGSALSSVNATTLGGQSPSSFWQSGGNNVVAGQFLGSTNNQPLELRVNNERALRLEPGFVDANHVGINVIGGASVNFAGPGVIGATIAGGGATSFFLTPLSNSVSGSFGVIGGGFQNIIGNLAFATTVAGGRFNVNNGSDSVIGGGFGNTNTAFAATIPGGYFNSTAGSYSFAAGRRAKANHHGSFVWADSQNADFASTANNQFLIRAGFVGINRTNPVSGADVFAIRSPATSGYGGMYIETVGAGLPFYGYVSGTDYSGGYAWTYVDGSDGGKWKLNVSNLDRVTVTPGGNVGIGTNSPAERLHVIGNILASGTITGSSDRNVKENFASVDPRAVLDKVAALPISRWNYKAETGVTHLGPMAQDFHAAFSVGGDDKHISMVDADGVALAAIQGLNQKLDQRLQEKDAEIAALKQTVNELRQLVQTAIKK